MPKGFPLNKCKLCHGPVSDRDELTARGNHIDCAKAAMRANNVQLSEHRGPYFDHWRRRMAASVGGVLLDEHRESA